MTTDEKPPPTRARYVKPGEMLALSPRALHQDRKGFFWMMGSASLPNERQGDVTIVHVRGELDHHEERWGYGESYEGIIKKFRAAYTGQDAVDAHERQHRYDDNFAPIEATPPKAIVMVVDSPGGVVSGLNECVAELRRMRAEHPEIKVSCYVNEMATSAAYALACSCDEIVCPPSAILGSVGVISTMISAAAHDKKEGFDVRLLTSGARKADGHFHAPISDAAIAVEQARVEKLANAFFRLVSKARPISVDKLRNLQAGIYLGKDAIRVKLADRLMAYADLLAGAQGDSPLAAQGGNQTDRRLSKGKRMNLDALIKKTKAALAATDDPTEIRELSTALGTYSAALEAYKKTEKHVEHVKTEESADEDEEPEEKSDEDEKKAKGAEEEKAASSAKSEDDEDDEDDGDDAKSAKKALALVQELTGKRGAAGRGEIRAAIMLGKKNDERLAALEKKNKADEKASLIASVTGKYFTPTEAKDLAALPLREVRSLVEFAKKRGPLVHTSEGMLVKPRDAVPGTEESLPQFTRDMIDAAVAAMPVAKREKGRAELVAAHLKSHNEQLETALNGAGRY